MDAQPIRTSDGVVVLCDGIVALVEGGAPRSSDVPVTAAAAAGAGGAVGGPVPLDVFARAIGADGNMRTACTVLLSPSASGAPGADHLFTHTAMVAVPVHDSETAVILARRHDGELRWALPRPGDDEARTVADAVLAARLRARDEDDLSWLGYAVHGHTHARVAATADASSREDSR